MARQKIKFLVDETGRKTSVVLPIKRYDELIEDLADLAVIAERRDEPAQPLGTVIQRIEEKWRTTGSK